jgi:hypothetical protein
MSAVENIIKTMMENELNPLYSAEVRARMEPPGFRTLVSFEEKLEAARTAARQVEGNRPGIRIIGACVYGSHMKGLETRLSDNDVLLIMQDKHTKAFKAAGGDIATQNLDAFIEKLSTSCVYAGALLSPYFLTTPDYRGLFGALTVNPYQLQVRMNRIIFEAVRSYLRRPAERQNLHKLARNIIADQWLSETLNPLIGRDVLYVDNPNVDKVLRHAEKVSGHAGLFAPLYASDGYLFNEDER